MTHELIKASSSSSLHTLSPVRRRDDHNALTAVEPGAFNLKTYEITKIFPITKWRSVSDVARIRS